MTPTERLHVVETSLRDFGNVLAGELGSGQALGISKDLFVLATVVARVIQQLQSAAPAPADPCLMCDGTGTVLQPITPDELARIFPGGPGERAPSAYLIRVSGAPARVTLCPCIRRELARESST